MDCYWQPKLKSVDRLLIHELLLITYAILKSKHRTPSYIAIVILYWSPNSQITNELLSAYVLVLVPKQNIKCCLLKKYFLLHILKSRHPLNSFMDFCQRILKSWHTNPSWDAVVIIFWSQREPSYSSNTIQIYWIPDSQFIHELLPAYIEVLTTN